MKPSWTKRSNKHVSDTAPSKPAWAHRGAKSARLSRSTSAPSSGQLTPALDPGNLERAWTTATLGPRLRSAGLPGWWVALMLEASAVALGQSVVTGLEIFSGVGNLSSGFRSLVGPVLTFEILQNPSHDILDTYGMKELLVMVLRIMQGGWLWLGTPCKSWVVLSRAFTRRTVMAPQGPPPGSTSRRQRQYLDEHNTIALITSYLMISAAAMGIFPILEQPQSSLLFRYPPIAKALLQCKCHHVAVRIAAFGGSSPKPLILKGSGVFMKTFEEVYHLRKGRPSASASGRLAVHTKGGFTGKKDMLTESSSYTRAFGLAMAWSFLGLSADDICKNLDRLGE